MLGFLVHVKFSACLVAMGGGLIAQISTTDAVSQGGLWIGMAGVITAVGAVLREYLGDRQKNRDYQAAEAQKQRDYDLARYKLTLRNDQNRRVHLLLYRYQQQEQEWNTHIRVAVMKLPNCPEIPPPPLLPDLPNGYADAADWEEIHGDA